MGAAEEIIIPSTLGAEEIIIPPSLGLRKGVSTWPHLNTPCAGVTDSLGTVLAAEWAECGTAGLARAAFERANCCTADGAGRRSLVNGRARDIGSNLRCFGPSCGASGGAILASKCRGRLRASVSSCRAFGGRGSTRTPPSGAASGPPVATSSASSFGQPSWHHTRCSGGNPAHLA